MPHLPTESVNPPQTTNQQATGRAAAAATASWSQEAATLKRSPGLTPTDQLAAADIMDFARSSRIAFDKLRKSYGF